MSILRCLALLLPFFAFVFADSNALQAADAKRPNVLLIVVDDQSPFDFSFYNPRSTLDAPVIERLASSGMVLDGAYHMGAWSGAVCTPSRHMIMSGRTVWHIPLPKKLQGPNYDAEAAAALPQSTLPAVFNRAGYKTMRTCKDNNHYGAANKLFQVLHEKTKRGGTAETGSAWHAERVLDYLNDREAAGESDPFLIYYGFSHPHDVRDGTPELLAKYGAVNHTDRNTRPALNDKQPPLPINYLPKHPFPQNNPRLRDEFSVRGVWTNRDEATIRNEIGRQYACSENIDRQIGRVLDKLKAMGELDNTYIIYTADHGMAIGRHGLQGKQNLYEHTWRVPLVVTGPGIKPGTRAEGNVYLLDLLATICDLTGVEIPATNEGKSFKPVLMGEQQQVRDVLYGVYCGGYKPGLRSVKKGDWKLMKFDTLDGATQETHLFNLRENPHEFLGDHTDPAVTKLVGTDIQPNQRSLDDDPRYAEKLAEMEALLQAEMKRLDDPFPLWDQE